jgi:hypothetical protein
MIKISHEVPLSLLEESRSFNDYDYALVHLFEIYPEYLQFFKDSLKQGREVLLDNSIFELKEAFAPAEFAKWIEELNPTRYIIPDVLDDSILTVNNAINWNNNYSHIKGKSIGVVQGRGYDELTWCYKLLTEYCDEVAICFPHSHHQSKGLSKDAFKERMYNRINLIDRWIENKVIREDKRHHLLGCLLPQEFKAYKSLDFIYSLDTSNPIIHGLKGIVYDNGSLEDKIIDKMADNMEIQPSLKQLEDIRNNINQFRNNLV